MAKKQRLDLLLAERYPNVSRMQLQSLIMQGKVQVDGKVVDKPGHAVLPEAEIVADLDEPKFASRAGFKLEAALDTFDVEVTDLVVLDAGLSTGGFTDCLLQRGARKVYGVDVGHGQVAEKIRQDARVVVMEQTNLRHLTTLPELVDLVTLDLSFISIIKVLPAVVALMKPDARLICLIKPQFEAERQEIRRGGLVTDPTIHKRVITQVIAACAELGLRLMAEPIESPLPGNTSGNLEFLALFQRQ